MKTLIFNIFEFIAEEVVFIYVMVIGLSYLTLSVISFIYTRSYIKKSQFTNYNAILSSPLAPPVSLVVPMYNEGQTIIDSARSLLSLQYNNYDIIIVNDGSKDDSLKKLIQHFSLTPVEYPVSYQISTKVIRTVYKSRNKAFRKLIVIDKANGGKADALNAGLNISQNKLIATLDADSILAPDALLKMVKPFLQSKDRVIATGGVIRIANSCTIEDGNLVKVQLPTAFLARFQALEYLRVFLLSRLAWSKLNGLLIVSGAFGLFDREIAVKAGGYYTKTVGEDMELIVRMRRYMHDQNLKYKVCYIPDPLCWTEAPATLSILGRQRNRWARGTTETLYKHKALFFNPKYGLMGLLSFPYWFFFEFLAPFVEATGIIYFTMSAVSGKIEWVHFFSLLSAVYFFAVFLSILALIAEEFSYYKYARKSDAVRLIVTAFLEPFLYHPIVLFHALKGNIELLTGKRSWGEMKRRGFHKEKEEIQKPIKKVPVS